MTSYADRFAPSPLPRPTGTRPADVRRFDMLPIEKGVPMPGGQMGRNIVKNTLLAMSAGDSFVVKKTSVATVYARAKELKLKIRVVKSADGREARVWRLA